ncbi:MAG: site-specific integrase [Acidaminococcaceae bacterium]|nr:site-specific integrase [Acidaminococcaceae bacterium]
MAHQHSHAVSILEIWYRADDDNQYKYLHDMRVFLAQIMDSALRDGLISVNPAKDHRIFNPSKKQPVEREALSVDSVKEIIPMLWKLGRHDRLYLALVIFTGMRRGEVLGVRWEDISVDKNLIQVNRNITYTNNQPFIGTPKTKSGYRSVPILPDLLTFLSPLEETGYIVFGADSETPMTQQAFRCMMKRIHDTVDLHGATAHVFRHTMGTMLNDAAADVKTIQSILGQSDFKTTMDRYVHPRENKKQEAIQRVGSMLQE